MELKHLNTILVFKRVVRGILIYLRTRKINMDFFEKSIIELQKQRPIFHSEDDLKLALAFKIKENNP